MAANPINILSNLSGQTVGIHCVNGGNADLGGIIFHDYLPLALPLIAIPYIKISSVGATDYKLAVLLTNGKTLEVECAEPETGLNHPIVDGQTAVVKIGELDIVGTNAYECVEFAYELLLNALNLDLPPS